MELKDFETMALVDELTRRNIGWPPVRPIIMDFAVHMEIVMAENDKEKGDSWKRMLSTELFYLGNIQMDKFKSESIFRQHGDDQPVFDETLKKRLLNISNYCMMLWHRLGEK